MKKIATVIGIIAGLIAIYNFMFSIPQPPQPIVITPMLQPTSTATLQYLLPIDLLSIEELKSRQTIYGFGENATVDFMIKDEREIPYNLTVRGFHNGTLRYGWSNESNRTMSFYSYYPVNEKGAWSAQVFLRFIYQNQTYSKDLLTEFEVSK